MTIKHKNGVVTFRMRTGKDFVKSTMPLETANNILRNAEKTSDHIHNDESEVIVDDKFFFPIERKTKKTEGKK